MIKTSQMGWIGIYRYHTHITEMKNIYTHSSTARYVFENIHTDRATSVAESGVNSFGQ